MKLQNGCKLVVLALALLHGPKTWAEYDPGCKRAMNRVELMICQDGQKPASDDRGGPSIYLLDKQLNDFYREARARVAPTEVAGLVSAQKKWLKEVRDACQDQECVRRVYQQRVRELQEISTLCTASEVVVYSCVLSARKVVSLCASQNAGADTGYMQFRLGRDRSSLEMEFPREKTPAKDHFKYYQVDNDPRLGVSFWSENTRWSVFVTKGGLRVYQRHGIVIDKGRPAAFDSFTECKREPVNFYEFDEYSSINIWTLSPALSLPDAGGDIEFFGGEH